jgi:YbgC/YbaW family acyl-CoA thioester hydrolase
MTEVTIPIRWRDVDAYAHINNAVYLTYLEEARDRWVHDTLGPEVNFVIVRIAIDYRRELSLADEAVEDAATARRRSARPSRSCRRPAGWRRKRSR